MDTEQTLQASLNICLWCYIADLSILLLLCYMFLCSSVNVIVFYVISVVYAIKLKLSAEPPARQPLYKHLVQLFAPSSGGVP